MGEEGLEGVLGVSASASKQRFISVSNTGGPVRILSVKIFNCMQLD